MSPGTRIGAYEIVAPLGAGGMGEVHRARDTKLQRDVAIKVLLADLSADADRLARFSREAQVLASLNHPNIAAVYGLEDSDGRQALVMELVEGPTLAERLTAGALPLDEALPIARQIAEALEAAHEAGIVHRDLKPANIKVRADGTVKVLDFGLAKALDPTAAGGADALNSPTLTARATAVGMILGTAAYMAPEQARGRAVDRRADIWAFGVVLYEMLTGRRAFEGDDISITLASVLKDSVDLKTLPEDVPPAITRLLRRCLEKDPRRRLSAMGDARLELDEATSAPEPRPPVTVIVAPRSSRLAWGAAALGLVAAGAMLVIWAPWQVAPLPERILFELETPGALGANTPIAFALSPDGRHLVARSQAIEGSATNRLMLRRLDQASFEVLAGTDGAGTTVFWSPDSRSIGFFAEGKLKIIDIRGGPPRTIADAPQRGVGPVLSAGGGATWNQDGTIVFAPGFAGPLMRVRVSGGEPQPVTVLDTSRGERWHRYPVFLPDGRHFLFLANTAREEATLYVGSLESQVAKPVVETMAQAVFAAPDRLLFMRQNALMAQRFDLTRLHLKGEPIQVAERVTSNIAGGLAVSASDTGIMAFRPGNRIQRSLIWVDRSGKRGPTVGTTALYTNPRLSPDGTRVALVTGGDIWIHDLARGTSTRFTFDPATDDVPVWSPDGTRIAFVSSRDGGVPNIYIKNANGTGADELVLKTANDKRLNDWSADGRFLLYMEVDSKTAEDLWALPLDGERTPQRLVATPFQEADGAFSPDGHWFAYRSNESGLPQIFVQSFPAGVGKWQVSTTSSGAFPRWRGDGREIYYDNGGRMMAVEITSSIPGKTFQAGATRDLFGGLMNLPPHNYDLVPDGSRFLILTAGDGSTDVAPLTVILNWSSGLFSR